MTSTIQPITRAWRRISAAAVIAIPSLVLIGWMTGHALLRTGGFGGETMRPNAAIALLFAGLALLPSRRRVAAAFSAVPFATGVLTLLQYASGADFAIDALLFHPLGDTSIRMSVHAAVAVTLAGAAGLAKGPTAHAFAVVSGFIGFLGIVASAYGAQFLPARELTPIAVSTALAVIVWAIAFLLPTTKQGLAALSGEDPWAAAMRRITVASICIPVLLGALCLGAARLQWFDLPFAVALIVTASGLTLAIVTSRLLMRLAASETELRRARDVLSARVAELEDVARPDGAVDELANRLAAANEELETFSYSVSHDLRAPLRAIEGYSQELLIGHEAQLDATGRHYLARIRAGAQRMSLLIDDLLSLSRVARKPLRREVVDVGALAAEIAEERNVTCVHARRGIRAIADPQLIRIVLDNLIANAAKFSAHRGGEARVDVLDAGDGVIAVRDNGTGFDMQHAHRIFAPFQRLHSAEFEGTGIGLAIVQRIIRRHGGSIRAESAPGQGATFYFDLGEPSLPTPGGPE